MADKNPALKKFALGPVQMILLSIQQYKNANHGRYPKRIELHPVVMQDFRKTLRNEYPQYAQDEVARGSFLGVPIIQNPNADRPRLITHEGKIEYL